MVEEKVGVDKQNSKKGFEKNENAYIVEGVSWVSDSTACLYLKVAGPTWKIQSLSKLTGRQVRKWKAEIQDTQLGLTGIGNHSITWSLFQAIKLSANSIAKIAPAGWNGKHKVSCSHSW